MHTAPIRLLSFYFYAEYISVAKHLLGQHYIVPPASSSGWKTILQYHSECSEHTHTLKLVVHGSASKSRCYAFNTNWETEWQQLKIGLKKKTGIKEIQIKRAAEDENETKAVLQKYGAKSKMIVQFIGIRTTVPDSMMRLEDFVRTMEVWAVAVQTPNHLQTISIFYSTPA